MLPSFFIVALLNQIPLITIDVLADFFSFIAGGLDWG